MYDLEKFKRRSEQNSASSNALYKRLQNNTPKDLDSTFEKLHNEEFEKMDCKTCANCCKSISPIIKVGDIVRIIKVLKMRKIDFIEKYLSLDEDDDYVFKQTPCPFLDSDNLCSIYDDRPKACEEYPHTDSINMKKILPLTYKNTLICPAVYDITLKLKEMYPKKGENIKK